MEVGVIRLKDIALVGIPEPDHLRRAHVGVLERHDDIALAIAGDVVERNVKARAVVVRVLDRHGEGHAVEELLLWLVAVEGCALRSYGDEDLDAALAFVCDGALGGDHAAHAPVVARDVIAAVAAGGQAQAEQNRKQHRKEMMGSFHLLFSLLHVSKRLTQDARSSRSRRPT